MCTFWYGRMKVTLTACLHLFLCISLDPPTPVSSGQNDHTSRNYLNSSAFVTFDDKTYNFKNARRNCKILGKGWDLPNDQRHGNELRQLLNLDQIYQIWLSLHQTHFESWTWIDEKPAEAFAVYDDQVPQSKCGGVSLQERNLRSMDCAEWRNGFVCEMPESVECPEEYLTQSCLQVAGKWYLVGCRVENWQSARAYCRRVKGDLAILNSEAKLNAVFDYIISSKLADKCSWLYVGIRKEDWLSVFNSSDPLLHVNWARGEPRHDSSCVSMTNVEHRYRWKTTPCGTTLRTVCQNYGLLPDVVSPQPLGKTKCPGNSTDTSAHFVPSIVILCVAVVFFCASIVVILCYRRRVQKGRKSAKEEESTRLLHSEEKKITLDPSENDLITVVIFSPGISHDDLSYMICQNDVENTIQDHSGTHAIRIICEEFEETAKYYDVTLQKSKKYLRIYNIVTDSPSTQLGPHEAEKLLQELNAKAASIDIVYLPGIGIPVGPEVLKLLRDLRDKCCVLCLGKHHVTEMPASEVLCIGLKMGDDDQIRTGILDIKVQVTDEGRGGTNTNTGVARMAGCIAGFLYQTKILKGQTVYQKLKKTGTIRRLLIDSVRRPIGGDVTGFGDVDFDTDGRQKILDAVKNWKEEIHQREVHSDQVDVYPDQRKQYPKEQDLSTAKSIQQCITCIKTYDGQPYNGQPITIVIAAAPISTQVMSEKWISIQSLPTTDADDYEGGELADLFIKHICNTLRPLFADQMQIESPVINIYSVPIRSTDNTSSSNWIRYHAALTKMRKKKPHVVYISSDSWSPLGGMGIKSALMHLQMESVVITGAKEMRGPVAPSAFPAESVLTVSRPDGQKGSLIDFISDSPKDGNVCSKEAWVAAADTVCAATAVLLRARQICTDNLCNNLRKAVVMRNILVHMCSDYPNHTVEHGFGVLRPSTIFNNNERFKELVQKYGGSSPPINYWSGKEIT